MTNLRKAWRCDGHRSAADFGRALREERKALGQTQQWVANGAGVTRETIVQLEAGKNVGLHIVFKVLSTLGRSVHLAAHLPGEAPSGGELPPA